jgi:hypothetical protein
MVSGSITTASTNLAVTNLPVKHQSFTCRRQYSQLQIRRVACTATAGSVKRNGQQLYRGSNSYNEVFLSDQPRENAGVIQRFGRLSLPASSSWSSWWRRQRLSPKRWITTSFSHGWPPENTSLHSVAVKASNLPNQIHNMRLQCC